MTKIKVSEVRGLIFVNKEVVSNIDLKTELKEKDMKPAMQSFIANKNLNVLKKVASEYSTKENELKLAATEKDEHGKPKFKKEGELMFLDIPLEVQKELQKEVDALKATEIEVDITPFSMETADVICTYLKDTSEPGLPILTGEQKTSLLLEKLMVQPA